MTKKQTVAIMEADEKQLKHCLQDLQPFVGIPYSLHNQGIDQLPEEVWALLIYTGKTQQETLAVCDRLRNHPHTATLPIVFVAPSYDITYTFLVKRAGNATLLTEPFTAEELRDCLEEVTETIPG